MDESQKHYVEQKKPEIKGIYYVISFIWNPRIGKNQSKLWKSESGYLWGSRTDYKMAQGSFGNALHHILGGNYIGIFHCQNSSNWAFLMCASWYVSIIPRNKRWGER